MKKYSKCVALIIDVVKIKRIVPMPTYSLCSLLSITDGSYSDAGKIFACVVIVTSPEDMLMVYGLVKSEWSVVNKHLNLSGGYWISNFLKRPFAFYLNL